jgi:hypothetical protein
VEDLEAINTNLAACLFQLKLGHPLGQKKASEEVAGRN